MRTSRHFRRSDFERKPIQQVGGTHAVDERAHARFGLLQPLGQLRLRATARQRVANDLQHGEPRITQTEFREVRREHAANAMSRTQDLSHNLRRFRVDGLRLPSNRVRFCQVHVHCSDTRKSRK